MKGKKLSIFLYALLLVVEIKNISNDMVVMMDNVGQLPPVINLKQLYIGDIVKVKCLIPNADLSLIVLIQGTYTNQLNRIKLNVVNSNTLQYQIKENGSYFIRSQFFYILRFSLEVTVNQTRIQPIEQDKYSYFQLSYITRYFQIFNQCTIQIDTSKFSDQMKQSQVYLEASTPIDNWQNIGFTNSIKTINMKAGEYKLSVSNNVDNPINYSVPLYTNSTKGCMYDEIYYCYKQGGQKKHRCRIKNGQSCEVDGTATCIVCGNNILNTGEDCDGVNHCTSLCKPETGYQCKNNVCTATSKCGDGKVDSGEVCDSVPHCTSSCKPETGYTCSNNICFSCGNNILQVGQECDNGNKPGCSQCKVVPPYKCKSVLSTSSLCYLCGNSIYELGEECDNGNKSGCINCTIDRGYKCKSKLNSISNCTGVCGDLILTADEQCDNGNMTGCINCVKDPKYTCTVLPLKPSVCYYCGNNILQIGEQCDNSNKKGCIDCKIQPGYNCRIDPRYCFQIKKICGNGERQIEEQCDDGNKANGDGCNGQCKIEAGYTCSLRLGEKSSCQILASKSPIKK